MQVRSASTPEWPELLVLPHPPPQVPSARITARTIFIASPPPPLETGFFWEAALAVLELYVDQLTWNSQISHASTSQVLRLKAVPQHLAKHFAVLIFVILQSSEMKICDILIGFSLALVYVFSKQSLVNKRGQNDCPRDIFSKIIARAQLVECLSSIHKNLGSTSSPRKIRCVGL